MFEAKGCISDGVFSRFLTASDPGEIQPSLSSWGHCSWAYVVYFRGCWAGDPGPLQQRWKPLDQRLLLDVLMFDPPQHSLVTLLFGHLIWDPNPEDPRIPGMTIAGDGTLVHPFLYQAQMLLLVLDFLFVILVICRVIF